jgi:thymidylate synthase
MTNIKYLVDNKVNIWNEWADENGDLGPVYGKQWVDWSRAHHISTGQDLLYKSNRNPKIVYKKINQIQSIVDKLTEGHDNFNPMDRGLVVSAWNVGELDDMALRPCHAFFQFQARELHWKERADIAKKTLSEREYKGYKDENGWCHGFGNISPFTDFMIDRWLTERGIPKYELSLQLYQRSADTFLGVPFNIASYSLLLHMMCHVTGMKPGKFVHTFGDAHLYSNHKEQVNEMLSRTYSGGAGNFDFWGDDSVVYNPDTYGPDLPTLWLNPEVKNIFDFQYKDIKVVDYNPLPPIKAKVAV